MSYTKVNDYRKTFSITELREIALTYNSYTEDAEKNLIGNNAIRDFLKWVEENKTIIDNPKTGE